MSPRNTGAVLQRLRALMQSKKFSSETLQAYIVPTDDAHQSEYISDFDKRRAFISGFTGSAGTAIVTEKHAALWTDGRYFLQAETQLDKNWTLMKSGLPETPSQGDWLKKVLPENSRVGVDPFLLSAASWAPLYKEINSEGHTLVAVTQNLIDAVWEDQPEPPKAPVFVHPGKYAGQSWMSKVKAVRAKMAEKGATSLAVTALDEVAWLLNLRGSDIDFNPVFFGYVIVTMEDVMFFVDEATKMDSSVKTHLGGPQAVKIHPYSDMNGLLEKISSENKSMTWVSDKSSYAIYSAVPEKSRLNQPSPVAVLKAVKNDVEIQGMRNSHIRDAVALCQYFAWLEAEIQKCNVTEVSGASKLEELRREQDDFVSLSFDTISAVGSNGAIIHYRPSEETDKVITAQEVYLVDSGAQYRDGTTDVTRTVHFGNPTKFEQECFTRVLKGHISLASVIMPNGVKGHMLDSFARASLWEAGLDYLHGTGHGVGAFLNVHEGPCGISYRARPDEVALQEGMVLSDEPGYYEDGNFGIRIESLILVKKAETQHNFKNKGFLTFEPITLVPIQTKMIAPDLLTEKEIDWINNYHDRCRDVVGAVMLEQGRQDAYDWLLRETKPIG